MTLIESRGPGSAPPRELLDAAPIGSRIVIRYGWSVRTVYRKQPNGLWRGTSHAADRRPVEQPGELSSLVFSVFDQETWRLHHPGLVRVRVHHGSRLWVCMVGQCLDIDGGFDSVGAAGDDARAHVANHAEIARVGL